MSEAKTLAVILGGGKGTRLMPLTRDRTKPAVPIGGKYRLIDVPVSNCLHSELGQIFILTQFNSFSLHSHLTETFKFDYFSRKFVRLLAAEQSVSTTDWYQGTADAVRKNISHIEAFTREKDLVLILSGDDLYKIDFRHIIDQHLETGADITISTKMVGEHVAKRSGILKVDDYGKIVRFVEKPQEQEQLEPLKQAEGNYLASMGIYLFKRKVLFDLLQNSKEDDFGKGLIPEAIGNRNVMAYQFSGYWEDIGTIRSFFEANLAIAAQELDFNFNGIYTHPRFLQPTKLGNSQINRSMLSDGCVIEEAKINHCLIGLRSIIGQGCELKDTVMIGADGYENEDDYEENRSDHVPNIGLGNRVKVKRAIIDKNARIGDDVQIVNAQGHVDFQGDNYEIRDGIVIIPKAAVLPSGTII